MKGRLTRLALKATEFLVRAERGEAVEEELPAHLRTGQAGEDAAYFYLREQGYIMVARNFRSSRHRGEIDLIGWDGDVLCFVEVKTRSQRGVVPAEMAVDGPKRNLICSTARDYLRQIKQKPATRFDVISLYFHKQNDMPDITLFKNAFPMS